MRRSRSLALVLLCNVAGCANMKPELGFDEVERSVSERAGMRVHWNNGSLEDQETQAAVRSLLEKELTADETIQIALLNNRDLQAVYEELNLAQADLVQAGLLKNPVFSGQVRFATTGDGTAAALDLTQEFVSLLFMPLRKGRAEAAFEAAKLRVTGAVLDLAGEARAAFYELQAGEQLLEMRATVMEATQASYELSKRLRAAGNNRDLDVSNERALHEQSKLDLAAAEAAVVQRREELNVIMGLWGADTNWRIASRLPTIPSDEMSGDDLERRAIDRSLDLAIARREIEVSARAVGIAQPLGLLSELDAGVAAEKELDEGWSVGPSISLPIPLFDQGQAAVGSAQARLRQATERYAATAVSLRAGVRAAYAATSSARDRALYSERIILPLRQNIVNETQLQYNAMQVGAFQLLQAKRDQIESGAQYVGSLREYWLARVRLDQILSGRMMPMEHRTAEPTLSSNQSGAMARDGDH